MHGTRGCFAFWLFIQEGCPYPALSPHDTAVSVVISPQMTQVNLLIGQVRRGIIHHLSWQSQVKDV